MEKVEKLEKTEKNDFFALSQLLPIFALIEEFYGSGFNIYLFVC